MPMSHSTLPVLSLLPSLELEGTQIYPVEREVDRNALLDVAPDRESLLISDQTIEEVRKALKMRIPITTKHWLYNAQKREVVKLREATTTTRLSVFDRPMSMVPTVPDENSNNVDANPRIRRVLSTSSIYTFSGATLTSIENRLNSAGTNGSNSIPIGQRLSTPEKLISPRPLGLTHILVVYATKPSRPIVPPVDPQGTLSRRKKNAVTYPEVIELPINDLTFILNVPNLAPSKAPDTPLLPRRLHKELPRVLMYVPHLDTFPELVIYLHTKNQAELFRKIIPEWIRDLIHPLPLVPLPAPQAHSQPGPVVPSPSGGVPTESRGVIKFLGLLVSGSSSTTSIDTTDSSSSAISTPPPEPDRAVKTISEEIAQVSSIFSLTEEEDPLFQTAARLDALRDNLCHIGYFNQTLWNELDICRDIVLRSISWKARLDME